MPQKTPNSTPAGILSTFHALSKVNSNIELPPLTMYVKLVAVTQEISIGIIDAIDKSTINTSNVNTSPAMGALKMPAMAAEAPQPTNNMSVFLSI